MIKNKYIAVRWPDHSKWVIEVQINSVFSKPYFKFYKLHSNFSGWPEIVFFDTKKDAEEYIDILISKDRAIDKGDRGEWKF